MLEFKQYLQSTQCLECKACCRFSSLDWLPQLLEEEKIALGKKTIDSKKDDQLFFCEYLNDSDHHCKIYNQHPFECRLYPFLLSKDNRKLKLVAHLACPYVINKIEDEDFQNYCAYISAVLKKPENRKIIQAEFKKFRTYPLVELYVIEEDLLSDG